MKNVDSRMQPFHPFVDGAGRLLELLYLTTEDVENVGGSVAGLQLGHQGMGEQIFLSLLLVLFHGSIEYALKIGRSGSGGRHGSNEGRFLRVQ